MFTCFFDPQLLEINHAEHWFSTLLGPAPNDIGREPQNPEII